jgi:single-strand DNA-binding protein
MSNDLNQCQFIGRLGKDPELRFLPDGNPVVNFSIACGWKTKNKEGVEWVSVVIFGKLAEICGQYLKKGNQVFVQGKMRTEKYTKDGIDRYSVKIVADRMQMLGSRADKPDAPAVRPTEPDDFGQLDDDIPF